MLKIRKIKAAIYNKFMGPIRPGHTDEVFELRDEHYVLKEKWRVVSLGSEDTTWIYQQMI